MPPPVSRSADREGTEAPLGSGVSAELRPETIPRRASVKASLHRTSAACGPLVDAGQVQDSGDELVLESGLLEAVVAAAPEPEAVDCLGDRALDAVAGRVSLAPGVGGLLEACGPDGLVLVAGSQGKPAALRRLRAL